MESHTCSSFQFYRYRFSTCCKRHDQLQNKDQRQHAENFRGHRDGAPEIDVRIHRRAMISRAARRNVRAGCPQHRTERSHALIALPTDGTKAANGGNGDFGTSPFFRQLSGKRTLASPVHMASRRPKHKSGGCARRRRPNDERRRHLSFACLYHHDSGLAVWHSLNDQHSDYFSSIFWSLS
jgi:hypothetical protein